MIEHASQSISVKLSEQLDYLHKPSATPPMKSIEHTEGEEWVALDDGNGSKSPLSESVMKALVETGLSVSSTRGMWTANGATSKLLKGGMWDDSTIFAPSDQSCPVRVPYAKGEKGEMDVLV